MKKIAMLFFALGLTMTAIAQRVTDKLDRGLVAIKSGTGVYLSWRVLGEEYYDVTYNVYRDGQKLNDQPLSASNYQDKQGTVNSTYTVRAVVRGVEQGDSKSVTPWLNAYKEIKLTHEDISSTLEPNDATCADVDGDGELEILLKYNNLEEDKDGNGLYTIFECLKMDGTRLWWLNCGPNMGDFQNNEQNIMAYDWDGDGKAEAAMRCADGTVIHMADGTTYTVGNPNNIDRYAYGVGDQWFWMAGWQKSKEYLIYMNGETGQPYDLIEYPLPLFETGEGPANYPQAWGVGQFDSGHRASKHFVGAPYLDGKKPSIFLARGIYTRHKMAAYDVNPATHKLKLRWKWTCNTGGPWYGQGYHNYGIADVDWDGRDEIVFGSMVIDDNGKGLSSTGYGHGDSQHCSDLDPYRHGQEIYACLESTCGANFRDATTSKVYFFRGEGRDVGRCIAGNFTNSFPGCMGVSSPGIPISCVTDGPVDGLIGDGVGMNMRIYWDGDLCSEIFNGGVNTPGGIGRYGAWVTLWEMEGSLTNNWSKSTPCFQGDIFGDWREEIIMRTPNNNLRIYSTTIPTKWRIPTLWSDHQYRNGMVWQMCGYNQPPHLSYFLGELEGITVAPPPLTNNGRELVADGGTIGNSLNGKHALVFDNANMQVAIEDGAQPSVLTFNVPTWVQGTAPSECTTKDTKINYRTYTCTVTGGALAGDARLVKQGDGVLALPNAEFKHTGETNIWAGTLAFDGKMTQSPLWLNRFAELNSSGEFGSVKADYGSVIRPGGPDAKGTLSVDELSLGFGARMVFDLFGEDGTSDFLKVKTLKIERKTGIWVKAGPQYIMPVIEVIDHVGTDGKMKPGKYVLAEVDSLVGKVENLIVEGMTTTRKEFYMEDGKLVLEIFPLRDASTVFWTGLNSMLWNLGNAENFAASDDPTAMTYFVAGDNVLFNDGAEKKTVEVEGELFPDSIIVNNTEDYIFSGSGTICGNAKFIKLGTGVVTMAGINSYTGGNHIKEGTVKVSRLANTLAETGNLGGMTTKPSLFTIENGATLQTTAAVTQESPMTMVGAEGGIVNNAADFDMLKALSGTQLTKKGAGTFFVHGGSSLKRLIIDGGAVTETSNAATVVEIRKGTLYDDCPAYTGSTHEINVPKGAKGRWELTRATYSACGNKLTGEGEITIVPRNTQNRVRIVGDWTKFEGTIRHNTSIYLPLDCSTGMPKATLDVAANCEVSNQVHEFAIGALTGAGTLRECWIGIVSRELPQGTNTWTVGNSFGKDFTFAGTFTDNGASNHVAFNKVGTCKMTFTGKGDFQGPCEVRMGELCLLGTKSDIMLGKNTLTVADGALLSGKGKLGNTVTTVNVGGTIRSGVTEANTMGNLNFNGGDLTVDGKIQTYVSTKSAYSKFTNIGTLNLNGTLVLRGKNGLSLNVGDEIRIFDATVITLGTNLVLDLCEPNAALGLTWDTSRLSEGILVVGPAPDGIKAVGQGQTACVDAIYDLGGRRVPKGKIQRGVYVVDGKKVRY